MDDGSGVAVLIRGWAGHLTDEAVAFCDAYPAGPLGAACSWDALLLGQSLSKLEVLGSALQFDLWVRVSWEILEIVIKSPDSWRAGWVCCISKPSASLVELSCLVVFRETLLLAYSLLSVVLETLTAAIC